MLEKKVRNTPTMSIDRRSQTKKAKQQENKDYPNQKQMTEMN